MILLLLFFLLGIGVGAFWFAHAAHPASVKAATETNSLPSSVLSGSTKAVLNRLQSPVEIRFYSMLDRATVSPALFPFSEQVNRLLSAFQRESNGKIHVILYNALSDSAAHSADLDGIKAFNLDKGNACYLGLVVACNDNRESLADLAPEWEPALEYDLSRSIVRVTTPKPAPSAPVVDTSKPDASQLEDVKRAVPNFATVSVEAGTQILRETALNDFKTAVNEMQTRVDKARQRLSQTQNGGSEAEQQAALKELQQIQTEQTEKLKAIAARLQMQITALKQLKGE